MKIRTILHAVATTSSGRVAQQKVSVVRASLRKLEGFDRPPWLYRSRNAIPPVSFHHRDPHPVTEDDLTLCKRLIDAYVLSNKDAPEQSGVWAHDIFRMRQRSLLEALDLRDKRLLAELLASMFRLDFVLGMAPGSLGLKQVNAAPRFARLFALNKLASLAESQGLARVENPEQGDIGLAFTHGVDPLVQSIETHLGIQLDFPQVGAAYGIRIGPRVITSDMPDQVYGGARLQEIIRTYLPGRDRIHVVEIGGGYGAMAFWFSQLIDDAELYSRYTIVDLPISNLLQGYFLSKSRTPSDVSFYGESPKRFTLLPTHGLSSIEGSVDVVANKDSMPEIPRDAVFEYLRWAREKCDGILYSYNQEAAADGGDGPQTVVPEALAEVGGFKRLRRDASWLRRGYAEEIYRPTATVAEAFAS